MPIKKRKNKYKKEPIDTWTNFFTDDMITTVLNNTNKKIMVLIEQMPEEVYSNDKYTYLTEVKKKSFLLVLVSHMQGACLDKIF